MDDTLVARARGLPSAWAGQEFDLVMADAAELAKRPEDRRPVIISSDAAVVDASGDISETSGSLHTSYGETGGELDDFAPAAGTARVWFAWSSDHRVRASAPAEVTVYPAPEGDGRAVHPRDQRADGAGEASWVVAAPEGERETTVELCYGDGACETRTVPAGGHSTAVEFSHTFEKPGTHIQNARIVETGKALDWAATQVTRVAGACPGTVPRASFPDVEGGAHAVAIDCVAWWQVAAGDVHGDYHPLAQVRRDQLASMLARLLDAAGHPVEPAGDQGFQGVAGNVHADNINALANAGIIRGVSGSRFAPGQGVRRDQMASLLVRAHERSFGALPPGEHGFEDVAGNVHREAIAKLVEAGVTEGTTPTTYAPAGTVTRAQMASFAMRLLSLWIEEDLAEVAAEDQPGFVEGDGPSAAPSVSARGRHVAFASEATNLVDRDTGGAEQVFVRDRATGEIALVSVAGDGRVGDAEAGEPAISADGDQVAFVPRPSPPTGGWWRSPRRPRLWPPATPTTPPMCSCATAPRRPPSGSRSATAVRRPTAPAARRRCRPTATTSPTRPPPRTCSARPSAPTPGTCAATTAARAPPR